MTTSKKAKRGGKVATEQTPAAIEQKPQNVAADIAATIRQTLEAATLNASRAAAAMATVNEKRTGTYTGTVAAAIAAGTLAVFSTIWTGLKDDIRGNVSGCADKLGCVLGEPDKNGKAEFVVPASMSVAVSVVTAALEKGISLTEGGKARAFKAIQTDVQKASQAERQAKAAEKMTDTQRAQAEVLALLAKIGQNVKALTEQEAKESAKILATVLTIVDGSANREAGAQAKAA